MDRPARLPVPPQICGRVSHLTGSGGRPADLGTGDLHDKIIGRYSNLGEPHGPKADHPNRLAVGEQAATNRITRSALNLEIQLGGASGVKCNGISPRYPVGRSPSGLIDALLPGSGRHAFIGRYRKCSCIVMFIEYREAGSE